MSTFSLDKHTNRLIPTLSALGKDGMTLLPALSNGLRIDLSSIYTVTLLRNQVPHGIGVCSPQQ
jgi:hypothetical protein